MVQFSRTIRYDTDDRSHGFIVFFPHTRSQLPLPQQASKGMPISSENSRSLQQQNEIIRRSATQL